MPNQLHLLPLLLLAACGALLTPMSDVDPGQACFDEEVASDGAWVVTIDSVCFSSSHEDTDLTCTVTRDGADITISALSTWKTPSEVNDDCRLATATCTLPDLPDGTYTVSYAGASTTIELGDTEIIEGICLP